MTIDTLGHRIGHYPIKEPFYDGIVYIICYARFERICLNGQYDESITLDDISKKYPDVKIVIFESCLAGAVYRYNNYNDKKWYKVGETMGYA